MFKKIINYLTQDYVIGGIIFGLMIAATLGCIGYAVYEEYTNPGSTTTAHTSTINSNKTGLHGGYGYRPFKGKFGWGYVIGN
jgi:hypothetical protein